MVFYHVPLANSAVERLDLALIDAATLAKDADGWVILDARPRAQWLEGAVPGAFSFSWQDYTRTDEDGVPYQPPPLQELTGILGRLGIDDKTPVVVYGDADSSWGGEGWTAWLLSWLGHKGPVRVLDGGIQSWRSLGYPTSEGGRQGKEGRFVRHYEAQLTPEIAETFADIRSRQGQQPVLVDTRSNWEWLLGHIPGAVHIPWTEFFAGPERRPLRSDELKSLLARHGIDPGHPIVYYCEGGIRSAYAWMAHTLAGLPPARNYEGGVAEWRLRSSGS